MRFLLVRLSVVAALAVTASACSSSSTPTDTNPPDAGKTETLKEPGAECTASAECSTGECAADFPGGYCIKTGCDACPSGTACRDRAAGAACFRTCTAAADCRTGYTCHEGVCLPPCTVAADCGAGYLCKKGVCEKKPVVGNACTTDAQCATGKCLQPENVCTVGCESAADCDTGELCAWRSMMNVNGDRYDVRAVCAKPRAGAATGGTCNAHEECASGFCHLTRCAVACKGTCETGTTCVASQEPMPDDTWRPISVCLPDSATLVWEPATWPMGYQALAPMPGNAVSLSLVTQSSVITNYPMIVQLIGPGDKVLYDASEEMMSQPVRYFPQNGINTMLFPNNPAVPLDRSGVYSYYFANYDKDGNYLSQQPSVKLVYKLAPGGEIPAGKLDLNFFIVGMSRHPCGDLNAASAPTMLKGAIDQMRRIYAKAGVALGEVRYFDLNRPDLATIDGTSEVALGNLFSTSTTVTGEAVNIYFVRSLSGGSGGFALLGVSGGIPGPPLHGTPHSGVVVTWEADCYFTQDGSSIVGNVMSHEVGHYLGLFHNIESDETTTDAIADTNTSPNNLMYWNEQGGEDVSAGQGFVMRNNAAVELQ